MTAAITCSRRRPINKANVANGNIWCLPRAIAMVVAGGTAP
jgi:hypothetical protein